MSVQLSRKPVQPEEYPAQERRAETKSEYSDDVIYAMAGASWNHVQIVSNFTENLRPRLRSQGCTAVSNDLKVGTPDGLKFYYPDVAIVCRRPQFYDERQDVITNPTLIIEALSDSAADYDRGDKFLAYQQLDSLCGYVLVSQHRPAVEQYVKPENGAWQYMAHIGLESSLTLPAVDCALALSDVYADVVWEEEAEN
jgi:Uma2 family endonuclease